MEYFTFSLPDFAFAFLSILLEGIPFVLLGTLLSGVIDAFLPSKLMTRMLPRNELLAVLLCGMLGLIFPMCECGIVPVIRRLIRKGLPLSCGIAYMLSAPIVNPVVALSTFAAFKGQDPLLMTSFRLGTGYIVAVVIALLAGTIATKYILRPGVIKNSNHDHDHSHDNNHSHEHDHKHDHDHEPAVATWRSKLGRAASVAAGDFLDVAMYLIIGAGITAVFNTAVDQTLIIPLAFNLPLSIASLMGLAGILSLCSTSDAFIAATFIVFPAAAKLAFMVFGPMMDLKLLFLYSYVFRKRFVAALALVLFVLIWLICWRADTFLIA